MIDFFYAYIDWILGISALVGQFFILKKWWWAPIFGLSLQVIWVLYALAREDYGLLPAVGGFTILYVYGIVKWTREKDNVIRTLSAEHLEPR